MVKHYTIKDVAKLASVSPSTVSLALNNSDKVRLKTKERVMKAAKELNYTPNDFAVALRQTKGNLFGVLVPDLRNPYYINIVSSIKKLCDQKGIRLQIIETLYNLKIEARAVNFLKSTRTTGYIFIGTYQDDNIIAGIEDAKIIFIDKKDKNDKYPEINIDNKEAMYQVTKYVISKGCRSIFYLTQATLTEALVDRQNGFIRAMQEGGLNSDQSVILGKDANLYKLESGYRETKKILEMTKPDAIITSSDLLAIGSISAIIEEGFKVPDDILITGFDNIDYTRYSNPQISTIDQPAIEIGKLAFNYLIGEEKCLNNKCIIKDFKFIKRESTNN